MERLAAKASGITTSKRVQIETVKGLQKEGETKAYLSAPEELHKYSEHTSRNALLNTRTQILIPSAHY
jgi:hypothetical protein